VDRNINAVVCVHSIRLTLLVMNELTDKHIQWLTLNLTQQHRPNPDTPFRCRQRLRP